MSSLTLLQTARQRGQEQGLPYAGALTPTEAHDLLQADSSVLLVDVRTNAERDWVGKVTINEKQHFAVQWNVYPGGNQNPDFLAQLISVSADKDTVILFLCRSGFAHATQPN